MNDGEVKVEISISEHARNLALMEVNILLEKHGIAHDINFAISLVEAVYDTIDYEVVII